MNEALSSPSRRTQMMGSTGGGNAHHTTATPLHQMTIVESPELDSNQDIQGQWENPRIAPPSPHVHYLSPSPNDEYNDTMRGRIIDEDLRLRIVRTPTESLHEVAKEDERRRIGKRKRKGTLRKTLFGQAGSKLSRGFSIGGSSVRSSSRPDTSDGIPALPTARPGTAGSTGNNGGGLIDGIGMGLHGMNDFAQQIQPQQSSLDTVLSPISASFPPLTAIPNTRTANQEEEAKAELFATPAIAQGESSLNPGGLPSDTTPAISSTSLKATNKQSIWKSIFSSSSRKKDKKAAELRRRRNVYLNIELPMMELDKFGLPREYSRNKVRTSKYTLYTFIPKNLSEQFRRVANLYFLGLIVLQVFPIFGGTSPYVAMLPLLAILLITAVKDGIEDYRRQQLDDGVNNSAVTRLGDWRNVNVATFQRSFLSRLFGLKTSPASRKTTLPKSSKVSKGVRKLREKEGDLNMDFLYEGGSNLTQSETDLRHRSDQSIPNTMQGRVGNALGAAAGDSNNSLEILDSRDSTIYAPTMSNNPSAISHTSAGAERDYLQQSSSSSSARGRSGSTAARSMAASSNRTVKAKSGVVDYDRPSPGTAKWERTLWKKLEVGDVVLLRENDQVPADIVVLSTSDPDGQCFVETKNLDGETNLKPRKALKATLGIQHEEDIEHAEFVIDSEPPHANLYSYNGVLKYYTKEQAPGREHPIVENAPMTPRMEKKEAITINELLLRGCAIRNTTWVIGLVVYTGADTKIMLNQGETPSKRSKIEKETNYNVLANFVILLAMCIACGIANGLFLNKDDTSARSYEKGVNPAANNIVNAVVTFGACLIVFQNIVPISLIITVELVKTIQAIFIYQDIDMYYEPLDHPCVPKTWNISDDLGQIEYIFSDKTGTLTQNVMEFKKCSINGVAYGEGVTEAMLGQAKREGKDTSAFDPAQNADILERSKQEMIQLMQQTYKNRYLREDKMTFIAPKAIEDLTNKSNPDQRQNITHFFRALAICHTVLGDRFDPDNQNLIDYKAESPDEAALVGAARDAGFVFLQRSNSEIEIEVMGQIERYQPLRVLEFNSSRKRMSVIVRQPDGRLLMICKGADSVIYQRLKADHDRRLKNATEKDMEEFANSGLRTLCIAYRYLAEEEFVQWAALYDAACAAVTDREDEIEKACEIIEKDLVIMGATALEDKLQVGVPDAIAQLHKAGIKLWILTGDKVQTAIEIGFSCNLLTNAMEIMIISSDTEIGARAQIEAGLDKINKARDDPSTRPSDGFAVVIDGETLRHALDPSLKPLFLDFTTQCSAVVCCRVSPSQKALTVKLVKDGKNAMTLAIGDGANDVAMIQEAHIGVGIAGLEGAQASMSADYAIGQFRFLTKLLLVHGRWCYIRVAEMHANFFYKNIVWVFAMFWYQLFCNFDSSYLFDYSLVLLYNLAFTSLPVIVMGAFDQDIDAKNSLAHPQLYMRGIKGLEYSRTVFWTYMLDALYQSAVVFFVPFIVYYYSTAASTQGYGMDAVVELGTTVAASAVITVTIFVGINNTYQTALMLVVLVVSALLLYIWVAIYSAFPFTFNYLVVILFSTMDFWAILIITQVIAIGPRFLYKYVQSNYYPTDNNIIREVAAIQKSKRKHHADVDTESDYGRGEEKRSSRLPAPHLDDVRISQTPLPSEYGNASEQQLEMSELQRRRASIPLDAHRFPPSPPEEHRPQPYDTTFSPPKQQAYNQSAIPMGGPASSSRRQQLQSRTPTAADAYEEIGVGRSPSAPTSPTLRERYAHMGRERQDSNTPLTPHMYDGTYGSPPLSPRSVGTGHYRMQAGSSALSRENSNLSFATARSGAETDADSDYGYAR